MTMEDNKKDILEAYIELLKRYQALMISEHKCNMMFDKIKDECGDNSLYTGESLIH